MTINNLFNAVTQLDLTPIKTKLMHVQSGEGWSQEKTDAVEKEYRRFLCLMKIFPEEHIAPLMDVDTFWHYHILDTMKYAEDCQQVFGYFQHHYPYVGIEGGEEGQQLRLDSGDRMRELYERTFDEAYPGWIYEDVPAIAFSAGPVPPHHQPGARAASRANAIAFSAGPVPPHDQPGARAASRANAIAFSAGPVPPHTRLNPLAKDIAGAILSRSGPAAIPRPIPVLPG